MHRQRMEDKKKKRAMNKEFEKSKKVEKEIENYIENLFNKEITKPTKETRNEQLTNESLI